MPTCWPRVSQSTWVSFDCVPYRDATNEGLIQGESAAHVTVYAVSVQYCLYADYQWISWPEFLRDAAPSSYKRSRQSPLPSTRRGPAGCPRSSSWWWRSGTSLCGGGGQSLLLYSTGFKDELNNTRVAPRFLPATMRMVPMMPHIGLVTAEGGTSFLPVKAPQEFNS